MATNIPQDLDARAKLEERFWVKVEKTDGCWIWTAAKHPHGYGKFVVNNTVYPAHRISWELHNGEIPEGQCVMHICDNTPCIRPDHLRIGTHAENMADRDAKGRGNSRQPHKLNPGKVRRIRHLHAQGVAGHRIAAEFGIARNTVLRILRGEYWKHVH